jgi:hypothetical protein
LKVPFIRFVNPILLFAFLLSGCSSQTPSPAPQPSLTPVVTTSHSRTHTSTNSVEVEDEPIYLSIIWHQHQPVYFKDPDSGVYAKPWVRVHATKDYVDMAAILEQYPAVRATFNLTPSLIRQIVDLEAGQKICTGLMLKSLQTSSQRMKSSSSWSGFSIPTGGSSLVSLAIRSFYR